MRLVRIGAKGNERPGVMVDGELRDVSQFVPDFEERFFRGDGITRLRGWLEVNRAKCPLFPAGSRFGPPIGRPSKIVCIGLNYQDHAREMGGQPPKEPVLFLKSTTSLCGPFDDVVLPRGSRKSDWEVELAVIIGRETRYVTEEAAPSHIAGYALFCDYSERAFQKERGGQWTKGKSCDTFGPLGPYLVTPDEISDPAALPLWLKVNQQKKQASNTSEMIFKVPYLVSYVSQFMTLLPGDVISTGTPAGVGLGATPPTFLKPGDIVEFGIEGLGEARQRVVEERTAAI